MKFNIITLGCKVNICESEIMKQKLLQAGYKYDEKNPDIVIVNTCSVTNMADNKSKKIIRSIKNNNQNAILVACGCMCENHRESLNELGIDILIGNKDKSKIVELLEEYKNNQKRIIKFYNSKKLEFEDMQIDKYQDHTRAFVKIQDGCNNYCSYCIIPYLRGNLRSKDLNKVIEECTTLANNNHKEIVLTGIHTGTYGLEKGYDLVDLINEISKIENIERIRISSIEIVEISDKFLNMLKENKKVCNHLHIPLQSGSEEILKLMNRRYNKQEFESIVNKIRKARPDINLSTDVIVGFPGETEEYFEECKNFCRSIGFSKIHVFPYSKREGTKACELPNHLENSVKKERARELIKLSEELEKKYALKFINSELSVLIEEVKNGQSIGHTSNYLKVIIDKELEKNKMYKVLITEYVKESVKGKVK